MNWLASCVSSSHSLWTTMQAGDWIQLAIAIVTFMAVIVALFQEKIKEWFKKSHLNISINLAPPDSHKIQGITEVTPGVRLREDLIYIRLKVEHVKGDAAQNVEVMLVRLWELKSTKKVLKKNFIPLNLKWANRQSEKCPRDYLGIVTSVTS